MKKLLISSIIFISTLCWTDDEIKNIKTAIETEYLKKEGDEEVDANTTEDEDNDKIELSKEEIEKIIRILSHPYFGSRFRNFQEILGIGTEAIALKVDFQLLSELNEFIPVALKIDYFTVDKQSNSIKNYLNMMVDSEYEIVKLPNDLVVYDLSQHYLNILFNKPHKDGMPFVGMIYEAATITGDDSEKLDVSVTQLGFSGFPSTFLQEPQTDEMLEKNTENFVRLIVQLTYAVMLMNDQGYFHGDLGPGNVLVAGNSENFNPLIIDFGKLISLDELKKSSTLISDEMLDKSKPENQKFGNGSYYLVKDPNAANFFEKINFYGESIFTSEWESELSKQTNICLLNLDKNYEITQLKILINSILSEFIESELIDYESGIIEKLNNVMNAQIGQSLSIQEFYESLSTVYRLKDNELKSQNIDLVQYLMDSEGSEELIELKKRRTNISTSSSNNPTNHTTTQTSNQGTGRLILV